MWALLRPLLRTSGSCAGLGEEFVGTQPCLVAPDVRRDHDLVGPRRLGAALDLLADGRGTAGNGQGPATFDRDAFAGGVVVGVRLLRAGQRPELALLDPQPRELHRGREPPGFLVA